jgi:hypothetical protein
MRLRIALPAILLLLVTAFIQPSFAQSSDCTGREAEAQPRSTDPLYADAMEVGRDLIDHGFIVKCILTPSIFDGTFDGQSGSALYRTDKGEFWVLFLPKAETFDALQIIEQKQGKTYVYTFRGTPTPHSPPHSPFRMEARKTYFINSGNRLFVVMDDADLAASIEAAVSRSPNPSDSCHVTKPPLMAFNPPSPYPAELPASSFWFGTENLWTMLPMDGTWKGLPHSLPTPDSASGNKLFWWHEGYDWSTESVPNLEVTGRRLDAPAPPLSMDGHANNGWTNDSQHPFMVVGIFIPTPGCWQVTGDYKGNRLTSVVFVKE